MPKTLKDARRDQRVAMAAARDAYDKAIGRAAAARLTAEHGAAARLEAERGRVLMLAASRRVVWREHHAAGDGELLIRLRRHQFDLSQYCRAYRSPDLNNVSLWAVRMIRTELRRRGFTV